jgi:lauroyl/myristoyl acyltransferase
MSPRRRIKRAMFTNLCYAFALTLRVLPQRMRFGAAVQFARLLTLARPRARSDTWLDSRLAHNLARVITHLESTGCRYTPIVHVHGAELITNALVATRGLILVTAHFQMAFFFLRWLAEEGHRVAVMTAGPNVVPEQVGGYSLPSKEIIRGPHVFLRVRRWLTGGGIVVTSPEGVSSHRRRTEFELAGQTRHASVAPFAFAERTGTPMLLVEPTFDSSRGRIAVFVRPFAAEEAGMRLDEYVASVRHWCDDRIDIRTPLQA